MSDFTLRVSQDSGYLQTLGGLGSPSAPLPVLLFPLCCRVCGLTLEEADLEGDKTEAETEEDDGGQVGSLFSFSFLVVNHTGDKHFCCLFSSFLLGALRLSEFS